jgi:16S rRNA (uracil1498-N3)-methyltransferase
MTRRRWIADRWSESTATLTGEQARHLARVLRAGPGMEFDVLAGEQVWRAVIATATEDAVEFHLLEALPSTSALAIGVTLSIFKFDRFEWALEKLTELGVSRIDPAIARRTEKHLAQAAVNRVERWRRIALEAAKQSRRSSIPMVSEPRPLREALRTPPQDSLRLLLAEDERQQTLLGALKSSGERELMLAVGPEGGWAEDETAMFREYKWQSVSLGTTILRAETAAIAACSVAAAWLGP